MIGVMFLSHAFYTALEAGFTACQSSPALDCSGANVEMSASCWLLLLLGLSLILYQGYRGFMFQSIRQDEPFKNWSKSHRFFLLALADGLVYSVSSASGYLAILLCWKISVRISDPTNIAVGTAAFLVFLAVYGILGVTGLLPNLFHQGKLSPLSFLNKS